MAAVFLFLLAYLAGVLTIVSPCILPVLPFVFARADRPFLRSGLPVLVGMAVTFALVATGAAIGGGWVVAANQYGRVIALVLLAIFGVALIVPRLSDYMTRPLVALGARLSEKADQSAGATGAMIMPSLLLGAATGLLWAPCAGPVLGLILTGAALEGANVGTTLLLVAYAGGAATSLALALLLGGRVFAAMKRSLHAGEWIRRGLGVAVLAAVLVIAMGFDTGFLTQLSTTNTTALEQMLLEKLHPEDSAAMMMSGEPAMSGGAMMMKGAPGDTQSAGLQAEGKAPELSGAVLWLNSAPLTLSDLKGKVVVVDFWTYSCINCLRSIPYVRAWAEKYKDKGLVVIGVHTPEFAFEKTIDNVKKAVADLHIGYPVAIDNDYAIWRAFNNQYWPAHYFIDAAGQIRYHHFGEGQYDEAERVIQKLLAEAGAGNIASDIVAVNASGAQAAAAGDVESPETYIGYGRAENFTSPGGAVHDAAHVYSSGMPRLNEWGLTGDWTIGSEDAVLNKADGKIIYRFHARDFHLVLGSVGGVAVPFRVTIDGVQPGANHGEDVDAEGHGAVAGQRLYQLVREKGAIADHTFEIEFMSPGVQAYAFTFG